MIKKTSIIYLLICVCTLFLYVVPTIAEEKILSAPLTDIIFVIDCSNSMNTTDRDKLALDTIKMFIDSMDSHNTRVGYVAYNGDILSYASPTSIATQEERDQLKSKIHKLPRTGYTDTGLGLRFATELLAQADASPSTPLIILLSDGETALSPNSTRTLNDSKKDLHQSIAFAKNHNLPIHTIALGNGFISTSELEFIASETKGDFYPSPSSENLVDILTKVIEPYALATFLPASKFQSNKSSQTYSVDIPNTSVHEANLIFHSSKPIDIHTINCEAESFEVSSTAFYTSIKIKKPTKQTIHINWTSTDGAPIYILPILSYDFNIKLALPDTIHKGLNSHLTTSYIDASTKDVIKDPDLYALFQPVTSLTPSPSLSPTTSYTDSGVLTSFVFEDSGSPTLNISFENLSKPLLQTSFDFDVTNTPPTLSAFKDLRFPINGKAKTYSLSSYFSDLNNDTIRYELISDPFTSSLITLDQDQLTISPLAKGMGTFQIKAIDTEGAHFISEPISIDVIPFFQYYSMWGLLIIGILFLCLLLIMLYRKYASPQSHSFTGRINGYFISSTDSQIKDTFTTVLYPFEGISKLSIKELLAQLNLSYPIADLENIYLYPTDDHTMVLYHTSQSTILIDHTVAKANTYYTISYDTKLSISSYESGTYELDLFYVKHTAA